MYSVCLSVCLPACLSQVKLSGTFDLVQLLDPLPSKVCVSVCLSVCLSVRLWGLRRRGLHRRGLQYRDTDWTGIDFIVRSASILYSYRAPGSFVYVSPSSFCARAAKHEVRALHSAPYPLRQVHIQGLNSCFDVLQHAIFGARPHEVRWNEEMVSFPFCLQNDVKLDLLSSFLDAKL